MANTDPPPYVFVNDNGVPLPSVPQRVAVDTTVRTIKEMLERASKQGLHAEDTLYHHDWHADTNKKLTTDEKMAKERAAAAEAMYSLAGGRGKYARMCAAPTFEAMGTNQKDELLGALTRLHDALPVQAREALARVAGEDELPTNMLGIILMGALDQLREFHENTNMSER